MCSCVFSLITFHFSDVSISTHVWMFLAEIHLMLIKSERWTRATRHLYHYSCPSNVIHSTFFSFKVQNWWLGLLRKKKLQIDDFIRMHGVIWNWTNGFLSDLIQSHAFDLTIKLWITIKTLSNALSIVWHWAKHFSYKRIPKLCTISFNDVLAIPNAFWLVAVGREMKTNQ